MKKAQGMKNWFIKRLGGYTQQEIDDLSNSVKEESKEEARRLLRSVKVCVRGDIFNEVKERPLDVFGAMVDYFCDKIGIKPFYDDGKFGSKEKIKEMLG